jgi:CheY-like chemotaxis protein
MWMGRDERSLRETAMPRLLVVDDEESICFSMSEYFSLQGYKVDTASEIEEAEKLLGSTEYKVVIQDLRLTMTNNQDGLGIIRLIREHNPQTRIIVLTAYGSAGVPLRMLFQNVSTPETFVTTPLFLWSDRFSCASWLPGELTKLAIIVLFPPGAGGLFVSTTVYVTPLLLDSSSQSSNPALIAALSTSVNPVLVSR